MSAYEEFCGCGEYTCGACFGLSIPGNAWLDAACAVELCQNCLGSGCEKCCDGKIALRGAPPREGTPE